MITIRKTTNTYRPYSIRFNGYQVSVGAATLQHAKELITLQTGRTCRLWHVPFTKVYWVQLR